MRALWKGGIRFGLVYIPVKLFAGNTTHNLPLDMLRDEDQCNIKYVRVCDKDGKEVPWENIVKGYKIDDHYVSLDKEDFKEAAMEKSETLDIFRFVNIADVSPRYFKRTMLIEPEKGAGSTFNLLRKAMEKKKLGGLCTFVMRNREKMGLLHAHEGHLYMLEMHWHEDLRPLDSVKSPGSKVGKEELNMATTLIDKMSGDFEPEQYKDEYNDRLLKIIKKKKKGAKPKLSKGKKEKETTMPDSLLEELKASLEEIKA